MLDEAEGRKPLKQAAIVEKPGVPRQTVNAAEKTLLAAFGSKSGAVDSGSNAAEQGSPAAEGGGKLWQGCKRLGIA